MSGRLMLLDVGQGDAIILHDTDTNQAVVVDCHLPGARRAREYLRNAAAQVVAVVITHLHDDHFSGIPDLVRGIQPETLVYGVSRGFRKKHPEVDTLLAQLDAYHNKWNIGYDRPEQGKAIASSRGGVCIEFLAPTADEERRASRLNDANLASAVMRVRIGGMTAMLAGDAPPARWDRLVAEYGDKLSADVFVLPHHGAALGVAGRTVTQLLDVLRPQVVAISVASRNSYGHPDAVTLAEAGRWVLQNDARLICTQLNSLCRANLTPTGVGDAHFACAGEIAIDESAGALTVSPRRGDHRSYVSGLASPQCAPVPRPAP